MSRVHQPPGGGSSFSFGERQPLRDTNYVTRLQVDQLKHAGGGSSASQAYHQPYEQPAHGSSAFGGDAGRMRGSSNAYANGANQNCGNVITDRSSTRLHAPPGGDFRRSVSATTARRRRRHAADPRFDSTAREMMRGREEPAAVFGANAGRMRGSSSGLAARTKTAATSSPTARRPPPRAAGRRSSLTELGRRRRGGGGAGSSGAAKAAALRRPSAAAAATAAATAATARRPRRRVTATAQQHYGSSGSAPSSSRSNSGYRAGAAIVGGGGYGNDYRRSTEPTHGYGGSQGAPFGARVQQQSSNAYANGSNQNCGNVLTDRSSTRLHAPPGGHSSFRLG